MTTGEKSWRAEDLGEGIKDMCMEDPCTSLNSRLRKADSLQSNLGLVGRREEPKAKASEWRMGGALAPRDQNSAHLQQGRKAKLGERVYETEAPFS